MIAGAPLGPDGLDVLAALVERHGLPGPLTEPFALALDLHRQRLEDPTWTLAHALARRRPAAGVALPRRTSPAPAARLLTRWWRRPRIAQSDGPPAPTEPELCAIGRRALAHEPTAALAIRAPDLAAIGRWVWVWAAPAPGHRRDLVAAAPPASAHWIGHAPALTAETARRLSWFPQGQMP